MNRKGVFLLAIFFLVFLTVTVSADEPGFLDNVVEFFKQVFSDDVLASPYSENCISGKYFIDGVLVPGDFDGDGFFSECGDCDDGNSNVYFGASEIECDGVDQDCDGVDFCETTFLKDATWSKQEVVSNENVGIFVEGLGEDGELDIDIYKFSEDLCGISSLSSNINLGDPGLVSYYDFESDVLDKKGTNSGVNNGGEFVEGKFGKAIYFDGNSYVEVPDSSDLKFSNQFSVELWVKSDSSSEKNSILLSKGGNYVLRWDEVVDSLSFSIPSAEDVTLMDGMTPVNVPYFVSNVSKFWQRSAEYEDKAIGSGDINNDGYDDVAILGDALEIYFGSSFGLESTPSYIIDLSSSSTTGSEVLFSDLDNDGYAEVITLSNEESIFDINIFSFDGESFGGSIWNSEISCSGSECASIAVADLNGDGYDDLVVGEPYYLESVGRVLIYLNSGGSISSSVSYSILGSGLENGIFGKSVAGTDVNGDGYDDLAVGCPACGDYGQVYVYSGGSSEIGSTIISILNGEEQYFDQTGFFGNFGWSIAGSDVNGDGYGDLFIIQKNWHTQGYMGTMGMDTGRVYSCLSDGSKIETDCTSKFDHPDNHDPSTLGLFRRVSSGDINGDGRSDVYISPIPSSTGTHVQIADETGEIIYSDGVYDSGWPYFSPEEGGIVSVAGDINGDGYDDVILAKQSSVYFSRPYYSVQDLLPEKNEWHHIVASYDGVNLNLYVDGVLRASKEVDANIFTSVSPLTIGAYSDEDSRKYFSGSIDEVALYNRALTPSEVLSHFDQGDFLVSSLENNFLISKPSSFPDLSLGVGYSFEDTLEDFSVNGQDAINGGANFIDGKFGRGVSFDGNSNLQIPFDSVDVGKGTISMWIYPESMADQTLFYVTGSWGKFNLGIKNGFLHAQENIRTPADWEILGDSPLALNAWNHVVLTHDGNEPLMYVNGKMETLSYLVDEHREYFIDDLQDSNACYLGLSFVGTLDDFGFYGRALSPQEVLDIYSSGIALNNNLTKFESVSSWDSSLQKDDDCEVQKYYFVASDGSSSIKSDALVVRDYSGSCSDGDSDGYNSEGGVCGVVDCDSSESKINPGASEICDDNLDNDCDGLVDCQDSDCSSSCAPEIFMLAPSNYLVTERSVNLLVGVNTEVNFCRYSLNGGDFNSLTDLGDKTLSSSFAIGAGFSKLDLVCEDLFGNSNTVEKAIFVPANVFCDDQDGDGYYSSGGVCGSDLEIDCDDNPLDDDLVCSGEVNCSLAEFCSCAECVHPGAEELCWTDSDCFGGDYNSDLVGYWSFDNSLEDESSYDNGGYDYSKSIEIIPGRLNSGIRQDYYVSAHSVSMAGPVRVDHSEYLNLNKQFTISLWYARDKEVGYDEWLAASRNTDASNYFSYYGLGVNNGTFFGQVGNQYQSRGRVSSDFIIPQNEWHHLAFVYLENESVGRLYYDGALVKQDTINFNLVKGYDAVFRIAGNYQSLAINKGDLVDEVKVWNYALGAEDIQQEYERGLVEQSIEINTCEELQAVNNNLYANYSLGSNIDCEGFDFVPIGTYLSPFNKEFDGKNHTIKNVNISQDYDYSGIFGSLGLVGTIKDVYVENVQILSTGIAGGLVGYNDGEIINCHVRGELSTNPLILGPVLGGLVGFNYGKISDSSAEAIISGAGTFGGFVGENRGGDISACYAKSNIIYDESVNGGFVGGFVGKSYDWDIKETSNLGFKSVNLGNAYCKSNISILKGSYVKVGGFAGSLYNSTSNSYSASVINSETNSYEDSFNAWGSDCENCFYDIDLADYSYTTGNCAEGKTTSEMQTSSTFDAWDFANVWKIGPEYPYLFWEDFSPSVCGDDVKDFFEVCDGTDLDEKTCEDFDYYGGELQCGVACDEFDFSLCNFAAGDCVDEDGDGYNQSSLGCGVVDCDDSNFDLNPGATETKCNGLDENCDGLDDCLSQDLVLKLSFENDFSDSSGNENKVSTYGTPEFVSRDDQYAIDLDVSYPNYDSVIVASNENLDLGENFSFSIWMNKDSSYSGTAPLMLRTAGSSATDLGLKIYNGGIQFGSGSNTLVTPVANLTAGVWYHVVGVHNGGDDIDKVYLNGNLLASASGKTYNAANVGNVVVGTSSIFSGTFEGKLDEAIIYNKVLSESEISELYSGSSPTPEPEPDSFLPILDDFDRADSETLGICSDGIHSWSESYNAYAQTISNNQLLLKGSVAENNEMSIVSFIDSTGFDKLQDVEINVTYGGLDGTPFILFSPVGGIILRYNNDTKEGYALKILPDGHLYMTRGDSYSAIQAGTIINSTTYPLTAGDVLTFGINGFELMARVNGRTILTGSEPIGGYESGEVGLFGITGPAGVRFDDFVVTEIVPSENCVDNDGDGYNLAGWGCGTTDCNDEDANISPGVEEIECDGIDQNCDGPDLCVAPGMIIYYPLDIDSSLHPQSLVLDVSGNENHGYFPYADKYVSGKVGNAVNFSVDMLFFDLPKETFQSLSTGTISLWVKLDKLDNEPLISYFDYDYDYHYFDLEVIDEKLNAKLGAGNHHWWVEGNSTLNSGEWYNIVLTQNGEGPRIFIDNLEEGLEYVKDLNRSKFFEDMSTDLDFLRIGSYSGKYFRGLVDEFKVWNYSLSEQEIQTEYERGGVKECIDIDGDGFSSVERVCGEVDCNDNDETIYPGAPDVEGDGIDSNCDGFEVYPAQLVAYYPFENDLNDYSGLAVDGVCSGDSCPEFIAGQVGTAVHFDGEDYIDINQDISWTENDAFSIAFWVKPDTDDYSEQGIMGKAVALGQRDTRGGEWYFRFDGLDNSVIYSHGGGVNIESTLYAGEWTPVVVTYDPVRKANMYINGELVATDADFGTFLDYDTFVRFGTAMGYYGTNIFFNGSIDEVKIYNGSLNSQEILDFGVITCIDSDSDGYGEVASSLCENFELDCDDSSNLAYPGADEVPCDGIDQDCNGMDYCPEKILAHAKWVQTSAESGRSVGISVNGLIFPENVIPTSGVVEGKEVTFEIYEKDIDDCDDNETRISRVDLGDPDLVSYYDFDSDVSDKKGANAGTNNGAVFASGKIGQALEFDGLNDYVEVVDDPSLDLTQNFSIELWMNADSSQTKNQIVLSKDGNYQIRWDSNTGKLIFSVRDAVADIRDTSHIYEDYKPALNKTWEKIEEIEGYYEAVNAVAIGDANGDGYDDVAIGVPGYSYPEGKVSLYLGSENGLNSEPVWEEISTDGSYGYSLAFGDVNGDGYDDLVVGAPGYASPPPNTDAPSKGAVYVYLGNEIGLASTPVWTGSIPAHSLDCGDVNGDGYDDIAIGYPFYSSQSGKAYVYSGNGFEQLWSQTGSSSSRYGYSIAFGDFDNNGYKDLAVGAPQGLVGNTYGHAYVYLSSNLGVLSTSPAWTGTGVANIDGKCTEEFIAYAPHKDYGWSLATGDTNNDGYDDLVVGQIYDCMAGSDYLGTTGGVFLYEGNSGGVGTEYQHWNEYPCHDPRVGDSPGPDRDGWTVAMGDIHGDGRNEIAVGERSHCATGQVYIHRKRPDAEEFPQGKKPLKYWESWSNYFVNSVASGDVNGDGYDDFVYTNNLKAKVYTSTPYDSVTNYLPSDGWHHIVATYDGLRLNLYVDGIRAFKETDILAGQSFDSLLIGGEASEINGMTASERYFKGKIDNVAIYSRALTDDEVFTHYDSKDDLVIANPTSAFLEGLANPVATSDWLAEYMDDAGCGNPEYYFIARTGDEFLISSNLLEVNDSGTVSVCGNNITEAGEVCDGTDLGNESCVTQEFNFGNLSCASDCLSYDSAECSSECIPTSEICDGLDNDCDDEIDEDLGTTTCGLGVCNHIISNCVSGKLQTCDPFEGASTEVCEGVLDEDCDGEIEEGCSCTNGQTQQCGATDVGECSYGVQTCVNGQWAGCVGEVIASEEICDSNDNDCDGQVDEELGTTTCGQGECSHTINNCVLGILQTCDPFEGALTEVCEGILDEDCDGVVDNGCSCTNGETQQCGETNEGVCEFGIQTCVSGDWNPTCVGEIVPSEEICDLQDNDCDGQVDEELGTTTCGQGECSHTINNCVLGILQTCDPFEGSSAEICDGILDEDCDGEIDEGCVCTNGETQQCGDTAVGECSFGTRTCVGGQWGACVGELTASAEICDGLDNDCNGIADDGLGTSTCGKGECTHTVNNCVLGILQTCDPLEGATPEVCEGSVDEDCDGEIDEGCVCTNGETQQCGDTAVGECSYGVQTCVSGEWASGCVGEIIASIEICDGLDNDCNGIADDGLGTSTCGQGICIHTISNCVGGITQTCDPFEGSSIEICDGVLDEDCDGSVDEDCVCTNGETRQCGASNIGVCEFGTQTCLAGQWEECAGEITSSDEICDGLDNDCDEISDEGLGTTTCGKGECVHTVENCVSGLNQICNPLEGAVEEICDDGLDNDCDGETDENCVPVCVPTKEICNDGLDNDCDELVDCDDDSCSSDVNCIVCTDFDGDEFFAEAGCGTEVDCNDLDVNINPGVTEICDGKDNNCNKEVDENLTRSCGDVGCEGSQSCSLGVWGGCSSLGKSCDDSLFCNGEEVCSVSGVCENVKDTEPDCSILDDSCNDGVCDETKDSCVKQIKGDGTNCDDGLFCTIGDVCTSGVCVGGSQRNCSDIFSCTEDVCDETKDSCVRTPRNDLCDDFFGCTDNICSDLFGCQYVENDDNCEGEEVCRTDYFEDPGCGLLSEDCMGKADGTNCDDGIYCNGLDECVNEQCVNVGPSVLCETKPGISSCGYNSDNPFALDVADPISGVCSEINESCIFGEYNFTSTCDVETCNAECVSDEEVVCPTDVCVGNYLADYPDYGKCVDCLIDDGEDSACKPQMRDTINCRDAITTSLDVKTGLNFISFAAIPENNSVTEMFKDHVQNLTSIYKYENGSWRAYYFNYPQFSSFNEIEAGEGYVLFAKEGVNFSFDGFNKEIDSLTGIIERPRIEFKRGWNLVGTFSDPVEVKQFLSDVDYLSVYTYDSGIDNYQRLDDDARLTSDKSYWVYSTSETSIEPIVN